MFNRGGIAVCQKKHQYVQDNGIDGFDIRNLDNDSQVVKLPTGRASASKPKQVVFANNGALVVGGSDHGLVYVFDRTTGDVLGRLRHAKSGLVQTVTVSFVINILS